MPEQSPIHHYQAELDQNLEKLADLLERRKDTTRRHWQDLGIQILSRRILTLEAIMGNQDNYWPLISRYADEVLVDPFRTYRCITEDIAPKYIKAVSFYNQHRYRMHALNNVERVEFTQIFNCEPRVNLALFDPVSHRLFNGSNDIDAFAGHSEIYGLVGAFRQDNNLTVSWPVISGYTVSFPEPIEHRSQHEVKGVFFADSLGLGTNGYPMLTNLDFCSFRPDAVATYESSDNGVARLFLVATLEEGKHRDRVILYSAPEGLPDKDEVDRAIEAVEQKGLFNRPTNIF